MLNKMCLQQAYQPVVRVLLLYQVATRLSMTFFLSSLTSFRTTCSKPRVNEFVANCRQDVDKLSMSWEQAVPIQIVSAAVL